MLVLTQEAAPLNFEFRVFSLEFARSRRRPPNGALPLEILEHRIDDGMACQKVN
jgi:hypothetical protein